MQTFQNDTNCAEITEKTYRVKISHMFNQLLILSQSLLKISSFNPYTSWQWKFSIFQQDSALHTQSPRHCLIFGAGNITVYITRSNSPDNPVDYTICSIAQYSMSTSPVCSKCQWTEAASVKRLVQHVTEYHWQRNWRVVHESASLFAAKGWHFEQLLYQH